MSGEILLDLRDARVGYGPNDVLKGISLRVCEGEIVALLGGNGAGKTTTLNAIAGLLPLRAGTIEAFGQNLRRERADERMQRGLVLCSEGRRIFPRLTVEENLIAGSLRRDSRHDARKIREQFDRFPILAARRSQLGGTLSGGEQQMLAISRALMSEPRLLMLDEPSLGLAPLIVEQIFAILQEINAAGTPVLLVEQNARQALRIAHRAYVLSVGNIVHEGTGAELLRSDEVRAAYLGE